jgi:DNA topoisomerase-1
VRLYDLIWRRTMASQMTPAIYDQTVLTIAAKHASDVYTLRATGSRLKFDGWTKLFSNSEDRLLPEVKAGDLLNFIKEQALQKFTQPPARYNDASIIKKLEELGIGRPSTYASIISVIIDRGYIDREQKKFFATPIGVTVSDFLLQNMPSFMAYDFTAGMEDELDDISRGEKKWQKVIDNFYQPFIKKIKEVDETAERAKVPVEETGEPCPLCHATDGGQVVLRTGKYGKFKSCSRYPDCKFTEPVLVTVENRACPVCGEPVLEKLGRFGKYYTCARYPENCDWHAQRPPKENEKYTKQLWEDIKAK